MQKPIYFFSNEGKDTVSTVVSGALYETSLALLALCS